MDNILSPKCETHVEVKLYFECCAAAAFKIVAGKSIESEAGSLI